MPTSTDLVTDLPADFEVFGQAVDTALVDLKGGTTGQVLAKASNTDMDFSWVAQDDSNAIQNAIVDAKGDLIAASANDTPARLAVGNNGETLVADSSTSTGLRWQGHIEAGKNFLINGGMDFWQRSTSAAATAGSYNAPDRWWCYINSGAATVSRESSIVPAGSQYAMKIASTGAGTSVFYGQVIETANAIQLAGQTFTLSAKVAASTSVGLSFIVQYNTSVDSAASWTTVTATSGGTATPTSTTYVSMSGIYAMPSTAKTIRIGYQHTSTVASGVDTYIGQIQAEIGFVATAFSRAGGTIQGELAACQRYYYRVTPNGVYSAFPSQGAASTTNLAYIQVTAKQTMRVFPTSVEYSGLRLYDLQSAATISNLVLDSQSTKDAPQMEVTSSGLTQYRPYVLSANNNANAYIAYSSEL
jgi:hypothetical protein